MHTLLLTTIGILFAVVYSTSLNSLTKCVLASMQLYLQILEQNDEGLKNASEKLQVLHKNLRKLQMPLNLVEEVQLALTLVECCLQSPGV